MMRVLVALIALCGVARAGKWPVDVPDGWIDRAEEMAEKLAGLRSIKGTVSVDGAAYTSPTGDAQLTVTVWVTSPSSAPTRKSIEQLDRGIVEGSAKVSSGHISDSAHWVGDQLVVDQVDDLHGLRFHQRRIHAAASDGNVHSAIGACAGAVEVIAPCEAALAKIHLEVPNQVAPSDHDSTSYMAGELTGVMLAVLLIIVIVRRIRRARR